MNLKIEDLEKEMNVKKNGEVGDTSSMGGDIGSISSSSRRFVH